MYLRMGFWSLIGCIDVQLLIPEKGILFLFRVFGKTEHLALTGGVFNFYGFKDFKTNYPIR